MHSAPSVIFPVGRSRLMIRWIGCTWAVGAATLLAWCVQFSGEAWRTALIAMAVLAAGLVAWRTTRMGEGAQLQWDGQRWMGTGSIGRFGDAAATVHLDFQVLMLVRLKEAGRPSAWLWLDRACLPWRWLDLRRALLAGARPDSSSVLPRS